MGKGLEPKVAANNERVLTSWFFLVVSPPLEGLRKFNARALAKLLLHVLHKGATSTENQADTTFCFYV